MGGVYHDFSEPFTVRCEGSRIHVGDFAIETGFEDEDE